MLKNIEFNFENDWKKYALDYIKKQGYSKPESDDLDAILYYYHSLKRRIISQKPRKVVEAKNFSCPANVLTGYELLKQNIEQGSNLNLYLSRKSVKLNFEDGMFNDWGIQHFHLGTKIDKKINLIEGTSELLFAIVKNDTIYCIGIYKHGDWSKQELISIIEENWQFLLESYQIKGAIDLAYHSSDDEIFQLRKHNLNTAIKTKSGNIYFGAGGGLNAAGGSADVMFNVIDTLKHIQQLKQIFEQKIALLNLNNANVKLKFQLEITPLEINAYCSKINLRVPLFRKNPNLIAYMISNIGR